MTVGRYANRISKGEFHLEGETVKLATNDGSNHLHGGASGFSDQIWDGEIIEEDGMEQVQFHLVSPDGDQGYPGTLNAYCRVWLTDSNQLGWTYSAVTDAPTVVNLCNHTYWNLSGGLADESICSHSLETVCEAYLEVDDSQIPTGKYIPLEDDDPMNFRRGTKSSFGWMLPKERLEKLGGEGGGKHGLDHCFVRSPKPHVASQYNDLPAQIAVLSHPKSGRKMSVDTTQPGVQVYTANWLEPQWSGICLETQHYPDSPNHPEFPSTTLKPARVYKQTTVHKFEW